MIYLNSIISKGDLTADFLKYSLVLIKVLILLGVGVNLQFALSHYKERQSDLAKSQSTKSSTTNLIFSMILIVATIAMGMYSINLTKSKEPIESKSLTEIAHLISVKDSQVKIEPLTNMHSNYFYDGHENQSSGLDVLDKDKSQIFKIEDDTFYNRMYLIDKNNHKSELSEDEKNMIKSKQKENN